MLASRVCGNDLQASPEPAQYFLSLPIENHYGACMYISYRGLHILMVEAKVSSSLTLKNSKLRGASVTES